MAGKGFLRALFVILSSLMISLLAHRPTAWAEPLDRSHVEQAVDQIASLQALMDGKLMALKVLANSELRTLVKGDCEPCSIEPYRRGP